MITHAMYDVLKGMSVTFPLRVNVKYGNYAWESVSEGAVQKLVSAGAVEGTIEGELGDYTLVFRPTVKAQAMLEEYEHAHKRRSRRG